MKLMTHLYKTPLAPIWKDIATGLIIANITFSGKKNVVPQLQYCYIEYHYCISKL